VVKKNSLGNVFVFFSFYHYFYLLFKNFLAPTNLFKQNMLQRHDVHAFMVIPLIFLAFGSIFA
jgi:NADH:ubiquinone oxidoreductase subunit 5 (subunit L)/multisubunit Na+/H+ antiporter MnhA subunit